MERYTKEDKDGRYYIESVNGILESNIYGHTYGNAIDRFAELEAAEDAHISEVEQLQHKYELAVAEREANVKGFTEAIGRIKTVVAAEIFAEIDSITKEFISGDIDGYTLVVRLFMLKNKHAEEKA